MKIYAKQVPPEYQESPLYIFDEWPENVFIYGNRNYNQHAERLDEIRRGLENLAETYDDMQTGAAYTNDLHEAICDELPRDNGRAYSRAERLEIVKLAAQYEWSNDDDILCRILELVTGRAFECSTIRGCCQGDWQDIIYPAEYGREWLEAFETEYFNTGTEWIIHDENEAPEDPDDISGYSVYCLGWNNDLIRAELAEFSGGRPEDIIMYSFNGWSRMASYEEVRA